MKVINTIDKVLDNAEKVLSVFLLIAMTVAIIIQIVFRIFNIPLGWTEELARYCFVWAIYIGTSHAARYSKHLRVDIFQIFLKKRGKFFFNMVMNISSLVFFVILAWILTGVLQFFSVQVQTSAALKINMIYLYAAPFVCSLLCIIRYTENIARLIIDYRKPEVPAEEVAPS